MTLEIEPGDAEQLMLSGMLQHRDAVWDVTQIIQPADFIVPKHVVIGEAILRLALRNEPTDPVAVSDELGADLSRAGGADYLHKLHWMAPTWRNAGYYALIVRKESIRRHMRETSAALIQLANDASLDPDEAIAQARAKIDDIGNLDTTATEPFTAVIDRIALNIGNTHEGIPTPWEALTRNLGGLLPGKLYVIAARPGAGKSALALQMAVGMQNYGHVGFFSLEMGEEEIAQRLVSQGARIPHNVVKGPNALDGHYARRRDAWLVMKPTQLLIDDRAVDLAAIRAQIRTWYREFDQSTKPEKERTPNHALSGIVIDYLQLMSGSKEWAGNKVQQISEISRQLKLMAKEFNVPVIALSQMNRGIEGRSDKVPMLSDLRDSGSIEQDADVVIFLQKADEEDANPDHLYLIVEKNRSGPRGRTTLLWEGHHMRAVDDTMLKADQYEDEAMDSGQAWAS